MLLDGQTSIAQIVKRRDILVLEEITGIQQSVAGGEIRLDGTSLLYVCPADPSDATQTNNTSQTTDPSLDLERYRDRITVRKVTEAGDFVNFSMLLSVSKVRTNSPVVTSDNQRKHERFSCFLRDETGELLCTFWDKCGLQAATLRTHQLLFLRSMYKKTSNQKSFFSISPARKASFVTLSSLDGLLSSPLLYSLSSRNGVRNVTIVSIQINIGDVHPQCGRSVIAHRCLHCSMDLTDTNPPVIDFFSTTLVVDDGVEAVQVLFEGSALVSKLLSITGKQYYQLTPDCQDRLVESVIGSQITALFVAPNVIANFVRLNIMSTCNSLLDSLIK